MGDLDNTREGGRILERHHLVAALDDVRIANQGVDRHGNSIGLQPGAILDNKGAQSCASRSFSKPFQIQVVLGLHPLGFGEQAIVDNDLGQTLPPQTVSGIAVAGKKIGRCRTGCLYFN